jgi:hypothetical protein
MRTVCLLFMMVQIMLSPVWAQTTSADQKAIAETVQLYFDGMMERDKGKLEQAFHPEAKLIGYRGTDLHVTPFAQWLEATSKGEKRGPSNHHNTLTDIEITGYTAIAKVKLNWPGIYYFDYLTLLRIDGQWKIVHKTWYEEPR